MLRHAEAETAPVDSERDLTAGGRRQTEALGRWMSDQGIAPALFFSSAARRAQQTATICSGASGYQGRIYFEDDLYDARIAAYTGIVTALDNSDDSVLIVGHNPEISATVAFFTGRLLTMSPCLLVCIEFALEDWSSVQEGSGILKWVRTPDY